MKCRECAREIPAESGFCNRCGAAQTAPLGGPAVPAAAAGDAGPEAQLWSGRYSLVAAAHLWLLSGLWGAAALAGYLLYVPTRTPTAQAVALAVALLPGVFVLGRTLLRRLTQRHRLTDQRLFIERGLLSRRLDEVELIRIDDVAIEQNLLERLFDVGTVLVVSTDASHPRVALEGIARPREVKELLRERVRARRARTTFLETL